MPTLALLVSCERAIVETDTKAVSLITLFTGMKVFLPTGQPPPEPPPANAVAPREWSVVTGWDPNEADEGKEFVQHLEVFLPDGKPFIKNSEMKFQMERDKRHYNTPRIFGFPVGQKGKCLVQVWLEHDGKPVTEKFSTYIKVE
jgi:hypothetical protein